AVSDDEDSKQNGGIAINAQYTGDSKWEVGHLDKSVFYTIENMEKGRISEATFFRTPDEKEGYRLIQLNSKTEPHRADLKTDYQRIQVIALQDKKNKVTKKWIEEKLKTTYVRVNNDYLECDFQRNWIKQSQYVE